MEITKSIEEIENFCFLHYNVTSLFICLVRLELVLMERRGSIFVNTDNSSLQKPVICQFWGSAIYSGVYGNCLHHFLT